MGRGRESGRVRGRKGGRGPGGKGGGGEVRSARGRRGGEMVVVGRGGYNVCVGACVPACVRERERGGEAERIRGGGT